MQRGRSMAEMLGVLAIVGILSIGGISAYGKAMERHKINKLIDQVSTIIWNIKNAYASQPDYAGQNTQTVIAAGLIPKEMVKGNSIINALGKPINMGTETPEDFFIMNVYLTPNACFELLSIDWPTFSLWTAMDENEFISHFTEFPVPLDQRREACDDAWRLKFYIR